MRAERRGFLRGLVGGLLGAVGLGGRWRAAEAGDPWYLPDATTYIMDVGSRPGGDVIDYYLTDDGRPVPVRMPAGWDTTRTIVTHDAAGFRARLLARGVWIESGPAEAGARLAFAEWMPAPRDAAEVADRVEWLWRRAALRAVAGGFGIAGAEFALWFADDGRPDRVRIYMAVGRKLV